MQTLTYIRNGDIFLLHCETIVPGRSCDIASVAFNSPLTISLFVVYLPFNCPAVVCLAILFSFCLIRRQKTSTFGGISYNSTL